MKTIGKPYENHRKTIWKPCETQYENHMYVNIIWKHVYMTFCVFQKNQQTYCLLYRLLYYLLHCLLHCLLYCPLYCLLPIGLLVLSDPSQMNQADPARDCPQPGPGCEGLRLRAVLGRAGPGRLGLFGFCVAYCPQRNNRPCSSTRE